MNTVDEMSYRELFDYIKIFTPQQRLETLQAGYEFIVSELEEECGSEKVAKVTAVIGLGTFMMADGSLENDDLDVLKKLFADDFTEDELIHIFAQTEHDDKVGGFERLIASRGADFLDHFLLMGMILCTNDGQITEAELQLAGRYAAVLANKR